VTAHVLAAEKGAAATGPAHQQAEPDVVEHGEPQRLVAAEGAAPG
jgi:hypothetical protein